MEDNRNNNEFEYTIVMDADYKGPEVKEPEVKPEVKTEEEPKTPDIREIMDRLYYEYEKMCLREPTVLDTDDAYPHSYQWRIGDRYDPDKREVLEEALNLRVKIADTEAYRKYVEGVKNRRFTPVSWD